MIEIIAVAVAKSIVSFGVKRGLEAIFKGKTFEKRLMRVIDSTIETYSKDNPIPESDGKHAFYESKYFLEELLIYRFFGIGNQIFGDRVELFEHTTYWIALSI